MARGWLYFLEKCEGNKSLKVMKVRKCKNLREKIMSFISGPFAVSKSNSVIFFVDFFLQDVVKTL